MRIRAFVICMATLLALSACARKEPKVIIPDQPPAPPAQPADNDDTYVPMNYYY